jgi:hydroxymethylglutaryl-CoA lyase
VEGAVTGDALLERVTVREVGPRDGLQSEAPLTVEDRARFLDALSDCGFPEIEAVSFVSPRAVPAMADAAKVWGLATKPAGVRYSALVPNRRGAEAAVEAGGFSSLQGFIGVADGYNVKNVGKTVEESLRDVADVLVVGHEAGLPVEVSLSASFGDPYAGDVPAERVADVAGRLLDLGVEGLSLGDTAGMATPTRVWKVAGTVRERFPDVPLNLHFHDTRGTAMANVFAALQIGIDRFDASVGGIGGSPFAPNAGGNVATEDLVHMLADMRIETGIELDRVIEAARLLEELIGHPVPGHLGRVGPRWAVATEEPRPADG